MPLRGSPRTHKFGSSENCSCKMTLPPTSALAPQRTPAHPQTTLQVDGSLQLTPWTGMHRAPTPLRWLQAAWITFTCLRAKSNLPGPCCPWNLNAMVHLGTCLSFSVQPGFPLWGLCHPGISHLVSCSHLLHAVWKESKQRYEAAKVLN